MSTYLDLLLHDSHKSSSLGFQCQLFCTIFLSLEVRVFHILYCCLILPYFQIVIAFPNFDRYNCLHTVNPQLYLQNQSSEWRRKMETIPPPLPWRLSCPISMSSMSECRTMCSTLQRLNIWLVAAGAQVSGLAARQHKSLGWSSGFTLSSCVDAEHTEKKSRTGSW